MSKVHYIVRRSRSGRFNFTLISEAGRITGSVIVTTTGRSGADIERDAHAQIRRLAETFAETIGPNEFGAGETSPNTCAQTTSRSVAATAP